MNVEEKPRYGEIMTNFMFTINMMVIVTLILGGIWAIHQINYALQYNQMFFWLGLGFVLISKGAYLLHKTLDMLFDLKYYHAERRRTSNES